MADSSLEIKMNNLKLSDRTPPPLVSDQSPAETYTSMFEATTPPSGPASPRDTFDQEAEVEELHDYDVTSLKSDDVKADPILADLARKQGRSIHDGAGARPGSTAFKARPAPLSTRQQGVGPRMTKSAALRQGLDWAAMAGPIKKSSTSETDKSLVSGVSQVREGVKPPVASLAAPAIVPRPTRASALRTGADGAAASPVTKKDYAAQAIANKAKEKEERERRRKSVALPASLSAPSIAPRQNRSSALKTGAPLSIPTRALTATSADNVVPPSQPAQTMPKIGLARRASVGVKSLGTPSIVPRLNKAALLRAPGSTSTIPTSLSSTATAAPPSPRAGPSASTSTSGTSSTTSKPAKARLASMIVPRPTKASLLREGLGAKRDF